jgi:ribulose-phosphate 3-epimerase
MSVNPGFGGQSFIHSSLRKIELLSKIRESRGLQFRIEVDGGVRHDTVTDVVRAGAQILVAGSAIFEEGDIRENTRKLLEATLAVPKQPAESVQGSF